MATPGMEDLKGPIAWCLPKGYAIFQRLNVIDNGVVSDDFIAGFTELEDPDILTPVKESKAHAPPDLANAGPCVLRHLGLDDFSDCSLTMWRGRVRHHLKGGNMNSHHHEVWRFVLIRNKKDGEGYLWPVGRDTDIKDKLGLDLALKRETEMHPDVEWLDISARNLTEFPPELFQCHKLVKLECHSNYIEVLPDEFNGNTFPVLDYLALNNCNLHTISPQLATITTLRWLGLNTNKLKNFPPVPPNVERLSLHCQEIGSLPEVMPCGAKLRAVSLHANKIAAVPPTFLSSMPACNTFSLMRNNISELPDTIGDMLELQDFWIYNNNITTIPATIGKCKILKRFWLDNNKVTALPESIGDCPELEQLYCSCNEIRSLPASLVNCTKLDMLAIDGNPVEVLESVPPKLRGKLVNGKPGAGQSIPARPSIAPASTTAAVVRDGAVDALAEAMAPSDLRDQHDGYTTYVEAPRHASSAKRLAGNKLPGGQRRGLFGWLRGVFAH